MDFLLQKHHLLLYRNNQKRVDGYKLFTETVKKGINSNTSHYFYGNSKDVIDKLISELIKKHPSVNISGFLCPPVVTAEELSSEYYEKIISEANPDIVWVSLGFPKQENVIKNFSMSKKISSNLVGIGFAIEWVAGTKVKAPEFLANMGLEWVFRLIQEPKRLYKRYLIDNSLFITYFLKQVLLNDKKVSCRMNILNKITFEVSKVLKKYSIEDKTELRISGYENYDYQINTLVKYQSHDSIDLLLQDLSKVLDESQLIQSYDIADNLFVNLNINAASIIQSLQNPIENLRPSKIQNIIIDYGGPNIGKPLHVGHLRPLNIGRSIYSNA